MLNDHTVEVNGHTLVIYGDNSVGPRPESYWEDIETAKMYNTTEEKESVYSELKAAAESGMDFSSRWFIKNGTNAGDLMDLKCRSIVPVELNAILFWNAKIISEFYAKVRNLTKAAEFEWKAQKLYEAIQTVLWHEDVGSWLDYDLLNQKPRNYFVATNLAPLWMNCYNTADRVNITSKVLSYINATGIDKYPGGVPNTLEHSGQQWDYPNVWAPMQYILVEGLRNLQNKEASELAYSWALRWVQSNYIAFNSTKAMFEKYSALEMGGHGDGGEYDVQIGFGWTNGVILEFLDTYGDRLRISGNDTTPNSARLNSGAVGITAMVAVLVTVATHILG